MTNSKRKHLDEFLENQKNIPTGDLNTQKSISATSIKGGGFNGEYIMKPNGKIISPDENGNERVRLGKIEEGRYGIEALDENGEVLFNEKKIKIQYVYSTFMDVPLVNWNAVVGYMVYSNTTDYETNVVVRLDFVKPTNLTIIKATLYYRMQDLVAFGTTARLSDVNIYLNPVKTFIEPASDLDYYRFSGGTTIIANIIPDQDEYSGNIELTSSQIDDINNGQNFLIAQQETSSDTNSGFCCLTLVLEGYLQP